MSKEEFPYRFYYHALKPNEKKAYELFLDGLRHMAKEITLPKEKGEDLNYMRATVAVKYDHPELDFLAENTIWRQEYEDKIVVIPHYVYSKGEVKEATQRMNDYINKNFSDLLNLSSPYQRILIAHDRLANAIAYDLNPQAKKDDVYRIDGPILTGKGVCLGIAKVFMLVLNFLRIKNHVIFGDALYNGGLHAWNVVYFGNEAYHIDLTWDLKDEYGFIRHRYFMLTNKLIAKSHSFHPDFLIPEGRTNVMYPFYAKTAFRTLEEAKERLRTMPFNPSRGFEILLPTKLYNKENIEELRRVIWFENPTTKGLEICSLNYDEIQTFAVFLNKHQ